MLCKGCGVEMRIVRSTTKARQGEEGHMQVAHVSDVRCLNPQCEERNVSHEVAVTLWESAGMVDPQIYMEEENEGGASFAETKEQETAAETAKPEKSEAEKEAESTKQTTENEETEETTQTMSCEAEQEV